MIYSCTSTSYELCSWTLTVAPEQVQIGGQGCKLHPCSWIPPSHAPTPVAVAQSALWKEAGETQRNTVCGVPVAAGDYGDASVQNEGGCVEMTSSGHLHLITYLQIGR